MVIAAVDRIDRMDEFPVLSTGLLPGEHFRILRQGGTRERGTRCRTRHAVFKGTIRSAFHGCQGADFELAEESWTWRESALIAMHLADDSALPARTAYSVPAGGEKTGARLKQESTERTENSVSS
jgi:hypothetical protein